MNELISYGKPQDGDALRLSILFQQVYIQTYALHGITHEFARFISKRFAPERIEQTLKEDPDSLLVAYNGDDPVGVAELIYDSTCSLTSRSAPELSKLYVLERFCGRGVGYGLLREAEARVLRKGYRELWLEVWAENPRALAFYRRQGYRHLGTVDFHLDTNTYKNEVMWKELV